MRVTGNGFSLPFLSFAFPYTPSCAMASVSIRCWPFLPPFTTTLVASERGQNNRDQQGGQQGGQHVGKGMRKGAVWSYPSWLAAAAAAEEAGLGVSRVEAGLGAGQRRTRW